MNELSKFEIDETFGKIIREYRLSHGLTQDKLSEQLDISLKYISRLENGKGGIKTETLIKCINVLGISPNILYKKFITNTKLLKDIDLYEKINNLSDENQLLIISMIDLLNLNK
ncbi:MAG: helix-turn-helix transcriptional regulator [Clostridia bacterium]|nr:helix-turn-helix transcriptional regulator [Clostridia bacterium]